MLSGSYAITSNGGSDFVRGTSMIVFVSYQNRLQFVF